MRHVVGPERAVAWETLCPLWTLVVQGLLLPGVVRWARLPHDSATAEERLLAEATATEEAYRALEETAARLGTDPEITERTRREYESHLHVIHAGGNHQEPGEHGQSERADILRQDELPDSSRSRSVSITLNRSVSVCKSRERRTPGPLER
ncbi:hypothetical protein ACIQ7D_37115 [Streptomyces sp. NPDC096310]|uniref:hypothetical protein n=1 Tax=Streptomyces sp. NPDC096310 TaxID=3366082 RepID=UPI00382EBA63